MTTVPGAIDATDAPVRKTITVKASAERAFQVFTHGFDTRSSKSETSSCGNIGNSCHTRRTQHSIERSHVRSNSPGPVDAKWIILKSAWPGARRKRGTIPF